MKKLLLLSVLLFVSQHLIFAQSGWTRNAGGIYAKLGYAFSGGDQYYGSDGVLNQGANNFTQHSLNLYAEYGVTNNITAVVNFPVYKIQNFDGYSAAKGIGNPQLELKLAVFKKFPVVSFTVGAELPTATQTNFSVAQKINSLGYFDQINLPTGYPDFHYWGTLAVSSSLGNLPGWISFHTKFVARTGGYSNQLNYGLEVGYKWTKEFWTNARITTQNQIGTGSGRGSFVNGQDTEFTTLGLSAAYKIANKTHINFDYQFYNDLLRSRRNVYSAPFYQLGFSVEL